MFRIFLLVVALTGLFGISRLFTPVILSDTAELTGADVFTVTQDENGAPNQIESEGNNDSSFLRGFGQALVVITVLIALMFMLAIGTEFTVEIFKLGLKLQKKPFAAEELSKNEKLLPGRLDDLSVSAEAQSRLNKQIMTLKEEFTPLIKTQRTILQLQPGDFTEAVGAAMDTGNGQEIAYRIEGVLKGQLDSAIKQVDSQTPLGQAILSRLKNDMKGVINTLTQQATQLTPDEIYTQSQTFLNSKLAEATVDWVETNFLELQSQSYEGARATYNIHLRPQFRNIGFSEGLRTAIEYQFDRFLGNLQTAKGSDEYLRALNSLLIEVERQRNALHSQIVRWWQELKDRIAERTNKYYRPRQNLIIERPDDAINTFIAIEQRDIQEDRSRVQLIRLTAVIVGTLLAYFLQVDLSLMVSGYFPNNSNFLGAILIRRDVAFFSWFGDLFMIEMHDLTAGVVLIGLAMSAASGFWHEQLSRLRNIKESAKQVFSPLQPIIIQGDGDSPARFTFLNLEEPLERLAKADKSNVKEVVSSQIELLNVFYQQALQQSRNSFIWALIAAGVGLLFFLGAIAFVLLQQLTTASIISLISGALVGVIAGINFNLYGKTTVQLADFQSRLGDTQRYLLADSVIEGIEDLGIRNKTRAELVLSIANLNTGMFVSKQNTEGSDKGSSNSK